MDQSGASPPSKRTNNEKIVDSYLNNKNLNEYEKIEAVKRRANQLEEKAKMQEQLLGVQRQQNEYSDLDPG